MATIKPATYQHAEEFSKLLKLNIKAYVPKMTAAHYDAIHGGAPEPTPENEERIKAFSTVMKLEPFQRGMKELAPDRLDHRLAQSAEPESRRPRHRERTTPISARSRSAPFFYWTDKDMHDYLPSTICRTSGIISIPPRPTKSASAACTRRGAERLSPAQALILTRIRNDRYHLDHLQYLETEAIHIMREVAAEFERPALLFSGGKDSICLLRLAEKAFRPSDIPMPFLNVDTGHHFPELNEFRDRRAEGTRRQTHRPQGRGRHRRRASPCRARRDQPQPAANPDAARGASRNFNSTAPSAARGATRKRPAPRSASSASATASANGTRKTSARKSGTSTTPA